MSFTTFNKKALFAYVYLSVNQKLLDEPAGKIEKDNILFEIALLFKKYNGEQLIEELLEYMDDSFYLYELKSQILKFLNK